MNSLKRSQTLSAIIRDAIREQGPLSFAAYMQAALYYPSLGYYTAKPITLGKDGDFTTAPQISPLFGTSVAKQIAEIFSALKNPTLLEIGAGTGQLASDLWEALAREVALPKQYLIYEISATLREKQKALLQQNHPQDFHRFIWLDELPKDLTGVIIANEVLDALPTHCFLLDETGIKERAVDVLDDTFVFHHCEPISAGLTQTLTPILKSLALPLGYASEINLALPDFVKNLCASLKQGTILLIDYGYGQKEYYHPERKIGTLTCFYQHQKHDNPLTLTGLQDITAHVDFTRVAEAALESGIDTIAYTTQAAFLLATDLLTTASEMETDLDTVAAFALHQAIKTLTLPGEMGELIKVMALSKGLDQTLRGFSLQDRRRDL